jgi:mRNA-degrading endonuclease RelE of RelBE toxin-antitoxin system
MKLKVYAILQLIIFMVYLFKPMMPYIEYSLNKKYIAKNLCINKNKPKSHCNGKCYLEKQLKQSSENDDFKDTGNSKKNKTKDNKEFLLKKSVSFNFNLNKGKTSDFRIIYVSDGFKSLVFTPPKNFIDKLLS